MILLLSSLFLTLALQAPAQTILSTDFGGAKVNGYHSGDLIGGEDPASQMTAHLETDSGSVRVAEADGKHVLEFAAGDAAPGGLGAIKLIPKDIGQADILSLEGSVTFTPLAANQGVFQILVNSKAWLTTSARVTAVQLSVESGLALKYTTADGTQKACQLAIGSTYRVDFSVDFPGAEQTAWQFTIRDTASPDAPLFQSGKLPARASGIVPGVLVLAGGGAPKPTSEPFVRIHDAQLKVARLEAGTGTKRGGEARPQKPAEPPKPDYACGNAITAGKILLFTRGTKPDIELPVLNNRVEPVHANYILTLVDRQGVELNRQEGALDLAPGTGTPVKYTLDTALLPKFGVYGLVLRVSAAGQPLTEREYYLGLTNDTTIPKSPEGATFLYGLDGKYGRTVTEPCLLEWMDAMGVDILRGGAQFEANALKRVLPPFLEEDLPLLRKHGIRVMGMAGPQEPVQGREPFAGWFEKELQKRLVTIEDFARQAPDIIYWELGNEPDLGYPDMALYVRVYEEMYKAVKRGNPKALVANGAITFWGPKGQKNAPRFFELVNPDLIDIIAYHAHGPGIEQEKNIYEQVVAMTKKHGLEGKPIIDTESGVPAKSKMQEDVQARTVLQKQVFAQSVGLRFLMSFRLHAFSSERGWGFLRANEEPQPAVLAYRTMTQNLKGLAFTKKVPLRQDYAECYAFSQADGARRGCVLWSSQPAFYNIYLKIADASASLKNLRVSDLYGNLSTPDVTPDGVVRVEVTDTPRYLLWDTSDAKTEVAIADSLLQAPDMALVIPDSASPLEVTVSNPTDAPLTATLTGTVTTSGEASVEPPQQTLTIPPHQFVPARLAVRWSPRQQGLAWPDSWQVFTGVAETDIDLATLAQVPTTVQGKAPRRMQPVNYTLQFLEPGQTLTEKLPAFVFGTVHAERDQTVRIGCSADWWMECWLNGQVVYSTMKTGNGGGGSATDHTFDLPLRQGDNLLTFKVLSGKGGWKLLLASPAELPTLLDPSKASNCLDLVLEADGKVLARERLALRPVRAVAPAGTPAWTDGHEAWTAVAPDFLLENAHVTNLYDKQPDRTKWWQGNADLSASAWVRADAKRLYLVAWVADDKDVPGEGPAKLWQSDSLQIGLSREGKAIDQFTIGRLNGETAIVKEISTHGLPKGPLAPGNAEIQATATRLGAGTLYRVSLDRALVGDGVFFLNFLANDNDDGYRKQFIEWTDGMGLTKNPAVWQQFIIPAGRP